MRLNIRKEQIDVMSAVAEANFERQMVTHLKENYSDSVVRQAQVAEIPVRDLAEEDLERLVRIGIAKARSYEVTRQSSIALFVAMMFDAAPNFDKNRICEVLLNDEEKTPDDRVDEIPNVLSEKNWESIRQDYDPAAWAEPERKPETMESAGVSAADIPASTRKEADPLSKTISKKTLARIAKGKKDIVQVQPETSEIDPKFDVNTVKVNRKE